MGKWSQYRVKYHVEWEQEDGLRDWIDAVVGDDRSARCKVCEVVLPAHHAGLTKHSQNSQHLQRLASLNSPPKKTFVQTVSISGVESNRKLQERKQTDESNAEDQSNIVNAVCKNSGLKYQPRWLMDPSMSGWLQAVEDDETKAYCSYCEVKLRAHYKDLERHCQTEKHKRQQNAINVGSSTTPSKEMSAACTQDTCNTSDASSAFSGSALNTSGGVQKKVLIGNLVPSTLLSRSATEFDLQCETDADYERSAKRPRHDVRTTAVAGRATDSVSGGILIATSSSLNGVDDTADGTDNSTSLNTGTIAAAKNICTDDVLPHLKHKRNYNAKILNAAEFADIGFKPEWNSDPQLMDWILPVDDNELKVKCKYCNRVLNARYLQLLRHSLSNKHLCNAAAAATVLCPIDVDGCEAQLSQDDQMASDAEDEDDDPVLADECADVEWKSRDGQYIDADKTDMSFTADTAAGKKVDGRRKRKSLGGMSWSQYRKVYRREWESDPVLKDWLAPVFGDSFKAACKYCSCILRAHYSDLRHHYKSAKHERNAKWAELGGGKSPLLFSSQHGVDNKEGGSLQMNTDHKISSCYVVSKNTWAKYRKRYRKQWEADPLFQGWIMPVEGDDTRARCRYCRVLLRAHNSDLRNHARTSKHATNVAFGRPSADPLMLQKSARNKNADPALSSRRRFGCSKDWRLMQTNVHALDSPDDSLASLSQLNTLQSFSWSSSAAPETTLILQNDLPLDEQLIASLPETPGIRYRVKKETVATDSESGGMKSKSVGDNRLDESPQQAQSDKELSSETLSHVARSLTLWEFMMLKLGRTRANAEQAKIAEILTEFSELHAKVKAVSHSVLMPATARSDAADSDSSKHVMLDSQELADCLGLQTGLYYIQPAELNKATKINCRLLIPPMRRRLRAKRTGTPSRYMRSHQVIAVDQQKAVNSGGQQCVVELADGEPRYVIDPDLLDPSSSVIVHGLDGSTAGHLVLVSENGELLVQCDAKDLSQLSHDSSRQMTVEPAADGEAGGRTDTLYIADDDNTDLTCDLKVLASGIS